MSVPGRCDTCGSDATWEISQHAGSDGVLRWSKSMRCRHRGAAVEVDDIGFPPPEVRSRLLGTYGTWTVDLAEGADRRKAGAVLRKILDLNLHQAAPMLSSTDAALWSGTSAEAHWVLHHLRDAGVGARVRGPSLPQP